MRAVGIVLLLTLTATGAFVRHPVVLTSGRVHGPALATQLALVSQSTTRLYLDLFGLGPSEVVIVAVVAGVLYGPDRLRGQLRDSGVKNSVVTSKGLRLEREERIDEMLEEAETRRKKRAWDRVNALIESEDENTLERLASWEEE